MKLEIISDGTPHGTKVLDGHTGLEIKNITRVDWFITAEGKCRAEIEVRDVSLHYKGICEFLEKEVDGGKVS